MKLASFLYIEVKHPVIYLPGICRVDTKTDKEYQYTSVRLHRVRAFLKQYNLKAKDCRFNLASVVFTVVKYWFMPVGYGVKGRLGLRTAIDLAKLLHE